jgi:hypothetical protein
VSPSRFALLPLGDQDGRSASRTLFVLFVLVSEHSSIDACHL